MDGMTVKELRRHLRSTGWRSGWLLKAGLSAEPVMRVVKDERVLKLIRAYLESGVMIQGSQDTEDACRKEARFRQKITFKHHAR